VLEAAAAGALSVRDAEAALAAIKAGAPSGRAAAATLLGLASGGGDQAAPPGDGAGAGRGRLRWPGPGLAAMLCIRQGTALMAAAPGHRLQDPGPVRLWHHGIVAVCKYRVHS